MLQEYLVLLSRVRIGALRIPSTAVMTPGSTGGGTHLAADHSHSFAGEGPLPVYTVYYVIQLHTGN